MKTMEVLKIVWILRKSYASVAGLVIILIVVLCAIFAPWIAPYDPIDTDLYARMRPPSKQHILGTDYFGRDLFSRIIYGSRISLQVGIISVGIGAFFGTLFGVWAGYFGGRIDNLIMRFMDILISFPSILLAIAIVATLGPGLDKVMVAVGITTIPGVSRITRGSILAIKEEEFVKAAQAIGANHARIFFSHILPNAATPIMVIATLNIANAIIMEAALSFLGIGVQPPNPTWGLILNEGLPSLRIAPWISCFTGLAVMLTVLGFNLLGDGLRDLMDPKFRGFLQRV